MIQLSRSSAAMVLFGLCLAATGCQGEPFIITPASLPNLIEGTAFSQTFATENGDPAVWSISEGDLPPNLSLDDEEGILSGNLTQAGTFAFTILAHDGGLMARTGTRAFTLTVIPRLTMNAAIDNARLGQAYSDHFSVTGGVTPYTFVVVGLPGGLTYDAETGAVSGTPAASNPSVPLQVTVTDSGNPQQSVTRQTTLVVRPRAVQITTTWLPDGSVGVFYSQEVATVDGQAPLQWAVTAGVLPSGLTLNLSTGVISGTPTTGQTKTFTITVTDDDTPASTDAQEFTLTVQP